MLQTAAAAADMQAACFAATAELEADNLAGPLAASSRKAGSLAVGSPAADRLVAGSFAVDNRVADSPADSAEVVVAHTAVQAGRSAAAVVHPRS